ncbi:MAG: membrane protein [Saprospiraceae bacterium]|nr:MAG: membrane protein [Saprospiraceae bacterium]
MQFILTVLINGLAIWLGARLLRGVEVIDFVHSLITGLVVALLNATLGKFFDFITYPLQLITLGLFSFVVDAVVLMIADYFLKGIKIKNFWWALALAIVVALVNMVAHWIV